MMIPNTSGMLSRYLGMNGYSEPRFAKPVPVRCAVVKIDNMTAKSSVRTDQSASHGSIEEDTTVAVVLFRPNVKIADGDQFEILGAKLRVSGVQPRNNVLGKHDHNEVSFGIMP